MAKGMLSGTSTNTASLEAISQALDKLAATNNVAAISSLNSQLQTLAKAMDIPSLPKLITHLEKLGTITSQQADELRKLNRDGPSFIEHLKGIGSAIARGNLGGAVAQLGPAMGSLGGAIGSLAGAAVAAPAGIVAVGAAIQGLVNKANPSTAFAFNRALDDLAGTMGQILTPVLQGITVFVRDFADSMQGLKPAFQPIMKGIGDMIAALGPLFQSVMQLAGPAIQAFGWVVQNVAVPLFKTLADAVSTMAKAVMTAVQTITAGLVSFDEYEAKSSFGAAIRPASYGSIEDIGKRTTLAALNTTDRDTVPRKIDKSNDLLQKILDKIGLPSGPSGQAREGLGRVSRAISTFGLSEISRLANDL